MDEYVGDIRQRVLERMDLSREMSDEEIENLIGEEASRLMQEEPISIRERLMLEARVFNSLRKLDALQELLDDPAKFDPPVVIFFVGTHVPFEVSPYIPRRIRADVSRLFCLRVGLCFGKKAELFTFFPCITG